MEKTDFCEGVKYVAETDSYTHVRDGCCFTYRMWSRMQNNMIPHANCIDSFAICPVCHLIIGKMVIIGDKRRETWATPNVIS